MALWQVDFFVLPKDTIGSTQKFELDDEDMFDDACFWKAKKAPTSFFNSIGDMLPRGRSWSEDVIIYGSENSNRFTVISENGIIQSVSFRIDFTADYESVLKRLIEFFILNGLVVLDNRLNVMSLNFETIKYDIENSSQFKKYKLLSKG